MFNPDTRRRRSIRLQNYDYSQSGAYFVTLCTQGQLCRFGHIVRDDVLGAGMELNPVGRGFPNAWKKLPRHYPGIELDEWTFMPNHLHGIVVLPADSRWSLGEVVGGFKSLTTTAYCQRVHSHGWPAFEKRFWQRNYWEHVIRSERDLTNVRNYIINNPANWLNDKLYSRDQL